MKIIHTLAIFVTSISLSTSVSLAQEATATNRVLDVQFPEGYTGAAAPVPDSRLDDVNITLMPVKLPESFLNFRTLQFVGNEVGYTASIRTNDAKVSISGTRISVDSAETLPGTPSQEAAETPSTFGEHYVLAAKTEDGAAYEITVECENSKDPKCVSDAYARNLLSNLLFVGGGKGVPSSLSGAAAPLPPATPFDSQFAFEPAGRLAPNSGDGVRSSTIYAPNIRFPVEAGPAFLNSQVYGIGGSHSKERGSWKDKRNYAYPWRDNFCEKRDRKTPACPSASGHQGVDIRPADPRDATHWAVAADDGRVTNVGIYSVTITSNAGTQFRYLHLEMRKLAVRQGERVKRGQRIGLISNDFGGTPTPVHLHFEILQNVNGRGYRHVPPYLSLVKAYQQGN